MRTCSRGFTYYGILLTIVLIGTSLSAIGASWSIEKRRADERQLLHIGQTFRRAIESYYRRTPNGVNHYPTAIEDLLHDKRGVGVVRHLREYYVDPLTGNRDWEPYRDAGWRHRRRRKQFEPSASEAKQFRRLGSGLRERHLLL